MNLVILMGSLESATDDMAGTKPYVRVRLSISEKWKDGSVHQVPVELRAFRNMEVVKAIPSGLMVKAYGRIKGRLGTGQWEGKLFQEIELEKIEEL